MKLAVIGKGGVGKTFVSATLARLLARRGRNVVAGDLDSSPGLAFSLGLSGLEGGLPEEAVEPYAGTAYGWRLVPAITPLEAVNRFATPAPDGVFFLGMGKLGDTLDRSAVHRSVGPVREVLLGLDEPGWDIVGDLSAGPSAPFENFHDFADIVMLVLGPTWRSAMTVRRLLPMVRPGQQSMIVANRWGHEPDHPGMEPSVRIPFDPAVADAERRGLSPIDQVPDSPAIAAISVFVDELVSQEVPV